MNPEEVYDSSTRLRGCELHLPETNMIRMTKGWHIMISSQDVFVMISGIHRRIIDRYEIIASTCEKRGASAETFPPFLSFIKTGISASRA